MVKVSKKEPLISIVVPIYNVEQYLERCIISIVKQTYKNLEIILINDGSSDNSRKICDEYSKKDQRIKVIHKKNGGLSDARNVGISKSKGEYIMFVDSDDTICSNIVEVLYCELIKNNADISSSKLLEVSSEDKKNNYKKYSNSIKILNQKEYLKKFFKIESNETIHYACGKLFKREILTENQFPLNLTAEDVVGVYKAILRSKTIVEIDFPYYFYYNNPDSITRKKFSIKDFDLIEIWDLVIKLTPQKKSQYLNWAKFNRNRIDFTLLMRMAKNLKFSEILDKYGEEYKILLNNLKKNKRQLINSKIPFSRKIAILLICNNYKNFVNLCSLINFFRRNR